VKGITVYLHNGELKHEWDGHFYNEHVLVKERNESVNPNSEMVELEVGCHMCGDAYSKRIHTTEEWRIDLLHTWLVGKFDEPCPYPRQKLSVAAKETWEEHEGEPLTNEVRMKMVEDIRAVCDDNLQVNFE
jgi:hypothetical protein